jgi:nicotinamide phosphoribosyltransferase
MNPLLLVDSYKIHHTRMYPEGMTKLYSNFTPRKSRIAGIDKVVVFGIQHFVLEYLIKKFNEEFFKYTIEEKKAFPEACALGKEDIFNQYKKHCNVDTKHIEALWDLGYLPIEIKALDEGTLCPIGVPMLTITNTHPDFGWLVNYLETLISCMLWQPITSATIAHEYKKILNKYAIETTGSTEGVQWQGHDFSMRGMSSVESSILSGMGHLISFTGTDTIPAIYQLESSYNAKGLIGASVPATEHSVMCMGTKESEINTFKRLLNLYPTGILSVVSDTWDLWKVCTEYLPQLKEQILSRDGKLVIRPDSGNPVDIICGKISNTLKSIKEIEQFLREFYWENTNNKKYFIYEDGIYSVERDDLDESVREYGIEQMFEFSKNTQLHDIIMGGRYSHINKENISISESKGVIELLWDIFGGTINEQGYKVLDSHIGAIYGDSITLERAKQICERLKAKGFASTNIVLGIGSYTYQYNTRDTFGFAMKATYGEIFHNNTNRCTCKNNEKISPCDCQLEPREIFKDPITDDGTKKSKKGLLSIPNTLKEGKIWVKDQCTWEEEGKGQLRTVFKDGKLIKNYYFR